MNYPIPTVRNNKEKQRAFAVNMARYKKAYNQGFYLECMWILYALLEDRSSAFFYHLGFVGKNNRSKVTGTKVAKNALKEIFGISGKNPKYGFNNLGGKLGRMLELLDWAKNGDADNKYKLAVKTAVLKLGETDDFEGAVRYLNDNWRDMRNQLTHALLTSDPYRSYAEIEANLEGTYNAIRILDKAVAALGRQKIRDKFNIQ